jgi:hypothetical protein
LTISSNLNAAQAIEKDLNAMVHLAKSGNGRMPRIVGQEGLRVLVCEFDLSYWT